MTDLFLGKAEVLEYSGDRTVKPVTREFPMPAVVRLLGVFTPSRSSEQRRSDQRGGYPSQGVHRRCVSGPAAEPVAPGYVRL